MVLLFDSKVFPDLAQLVKDELEACRAPRPVVLPRRLGEFFRWTRIYHNIASFFK